MKDGKIKHMVAEAPLKHRGPGRPKLPSTARKLRRVTMLPPDECARLERASAQLGVSEAEIIRRALERELDQHGIAN